MESKKSETKTYFEKDGRKFIINSFDPMEGNFILTQVLSFALPFGLSDLLFKEVAGGSEMTPEVPKFGNGRSMGKAEFIELQRDILKTVEEEYAGGNTSPVVRENGTYGIADVTMGLTINLIVASLAFNFKDFFAGSQLKDLLTKL